MSTEQPPDLDTDDVTDRHAGRHDERPRPNTEATLDDVRDTIAAESPPNHADADQR
jgi:hypothetical protein